MPWWVLPLMIVMGGVVVTRLGMMVGVWVVGCDYSDDSSGVGDDSGWGASGDDVEGWVVVVLSIK